MKNLLLLSITDFKLIFRDSSLRIFLAMPLLIIAMVLFGLPALIEEYPIVQHYASYILMGASLQTSTMFGFIYSMVLIHEKDIQVAKVYGVLPVSKMGFIASRQVIPFTLSALVTFLLLQVQSFYIFKIEDAILFSLLCGLFAPLLSLSVTLFSKNKMEGMTWFKLMNLLVSIPLVGFFIPCCAWAFAIIPTYWVFETLNSMALGEMILMPIIIGFGLSIGLLYLLIWRFSKSHFS
ncbi:MULTISPECIES: hypothetical protein [unclassified Lentimicrobium]|uniref:hypothetical protein n=1 Tax=unclassified Lentimicrobium TaxID=2677434 RepID=UPI0015557D14|nr:MULTISPECIES: hypothetical protein [unclassified Lentimicrobium]NPD44084.1 hypothetical protein [Lentimicrobium sp. S6]NPD86733.1 hypothetical protein [Lentimicrobium sp. L6]